ncbi:cupin domain-containing protein [Spirulina sp. CS-785/01]|uniref:cupin domain-containing protein n=1 Tax=Spirulina sp. CS-785/01 TaxID=3021716 RepID=UPI0023306A5C|nr:cupin domain-containing protein [Spirulina sp. CS-785/01]MDB9312835.1 cupin domain-containing protein [Spirulina sp. CS-785/01]
MQPMEWNLATLLHPLPCDTFFSQYWEQQAVVLPTENRNRFNALFTWEQVNYLLNFHRLQYGDDLRLVRDGETLPPETAKDWRKQMQQGATLILNHVHELDPRLATLATQLRYELGHRVQINLYCTPQEQQGFDCHYDTHEVLVLQLDGEKEWFILPETEKFPMKGTRPPNELPPDESPYLKVVLKPGDGLYVPRGHWHYAVPVGERPSLHLTIGVSTYKGLDWLSWLEQQLQQNPHWRQSLPLIQHNPQGVKAHLQALAQELQDSCWIEDYMQVLKQETGANTPLSLPQQLGYDLFEQGLETRFWRPTTQPLQVEMIAEGGMCVRLGKKELQFQGDNLTVVRWIVQRSEFSVLDLAEVAPHLDWETEVVPLLYQLVTEGVYLVS